MMLPLEMPGAGSPIRPRDYQAEAIESVLTAPNRSVTRPLVVMPTGGGKTVVFSHVIVARPGRSLVLAHRDELIEQARAKLGKVSGGGLDIGIVKARQRRGLAHPCMVGSVQTLVKTRPRRSWTTAGSRPSSVDEAITA